MANNFIQFTTNTNDTIWVDAGKITAIRVTSDKNFSGLVLDGQESTFWVKNPIEASLAQGGIQLKA